MYLIQGREAPAIHNFQAKSTVVTQRSWDCFSPDLVMPLLVAMMRMGAMSPSSARFRKEKHSISSMCTSSMNRTCTQTHTKHTIVSEQRDYHTLTPGTISAFPSSLHSATFALICSRTSPFISPVSPADGQLHTDCNATNIHVRRPASYQGFQYHVHYGFATCSQ